MLELERVPPKHHILNITDTLSKPTAPRSLRAVVIGLGKKGFLWDVDDPLRIKPDTHVGAYIGNPNIELVAAAEIKGELITKFKQVYPDIPVYQIGMEEMLYKLKPDIVSIATPTETHTELVALVSRYDSVKVIFLEKPIAPTLEEAQKIIDCGELFGVNIVINHQRRWSPIWRSAKTYVETVKPMYMVGYCSGSTLEAGIHMADLFEWYGHDCPNTYVPVNLHHLPYKPYLVFEVDVFGETGRVRITDNGRKLEVYLMEPSPHYKDIAELKQTFLGGYADEKTPMELAVQHLVDIIWNGVPSYCNALDGYKALHSCLQWLELEKQWKLPVNEWSQASIKFIPDGADDEEDDEWGEDKEDDDFMYEKGE